MTGEQRDKITKITRAIYDAQGCMFPEDDYEMVEYLSESEHPQEINCIRLALIAHEIYTGESMDEFEFYEWHGL